MAGDWIPMRLDLYNDPAVIAIAAATKLDEHGVIGRLYRLWCWANAHLTDGFASQVPSKWVDTYLSTPGFAAAMLRAGWLRVRAKGIVFPHFDRWNSRGAKTRLQTAIRVQEHRRNGGCNDPPVTGALPEKRRGQKRKPPNPQPPSPDGEGGLFGRFYVVYPKQTCPAKARAEWGELAPSPELAEQIIVAAAEQATWPGERRKPHVWLRQRGWEDARPTGTTLTRESADDKRRRAIAEETNRGPT